MEKDSKTECWGESHREAKDFHQLRKVMERMHAVPALSKGILLLYGGTVQIFGQLSAMKICTSAFAMLDAMTLLGQALLTDLQLQFQSCCDRLLVL